MMYVSGETAEASSETTGMIEEIVRQQVIEMVCDIYLDMTIVLELHLGAVSDPSLVLFPFVKSLLTFRSYDNARSKHPVEGADQSQRMT